MSDKKVKIFRYVRIYTYFLSFSNYFTENCGVRMEISRFIPGTTELPGSEISGTELLGPEIRHLVPAPGVML
ncbi:hypothetical protein HMPREF9413_4597 [Paenibacillus sp. HGF7]|nr:hypothetical protein HMPREF9413_4597 [Paenibacillus sp. HGF7]